MSNQSTVSMLAEKMAFSPAGAMAAPAGPPAQAPMDPAAMQGAMPPMDPSMGAGMAAAGGAAPVDPATGMPMDPAAMGGAPGGMPPGMSPGGSPDDLAMMPVTELTVGDLAGLIAEVVTQAMGGEAGVPEEAGPAPESEPKGEAEGTKATEADIVDRLDQILALLSGEPSMAGAPPPQPMGPEAGAVAPEGPGPKMASVNRSIADMICERVKGISA
jgi:hypothetical protein